MVGLRTIGSRGQRVTRGRGPENRAPRARIARLTQIGCPCGIPVHPGDIPTPNGVDRHPQPAREGQGPGPSRHRGPEEAHGCKRAGAWDLRVSMEKAQEGVWLLVISLSYPRQTLPNIDVHWPSRARDACAKTPVSRRDFPANPYSLKWSFSSMAWVYLGINNWRPLP